MMIKKKSADGITANIFHLLVYHSASLNHYFISHSNYLLMLLCQDIYSIIPMFSAKFYVFFDDRCLEI